MSVPPPPSAPAAAAGLVLSNRQLAPGILSLKLRLPRAWGPPSPGQFVQVECPPPDCFGLCRPFGLAGHARTAEGTEIEIVYGVVGRRTQALSEVAAGDRLDVTGPHGRAFAPLAGRRPVLVGGGRGIAPLCLAADAWREDHPDGLLVYGMRGAGDRIPLPPQPYPLELATEDGSLGYRGTALDLLQHLLLGGGLRSAESALYACGPNAMLAALSSWAEEAQIPCQVSLETRFGCGFGICAGCAVPLRAGEKAEADPFLRYALACQDGPVMDGASVDWERLRE
jgi:dihydroorotate dehydrogenase electron transfer subunit